MSHLRSTGIRSVIAATALAAGLASGLTAATAYAAGSSKAAMPMVLPTTVTWHKIGLQNGWKPAANTKFTVAAPSYAVSGGIVYLDGVLHQPSGSNKQFGVLPLGYRPAHTLYLTVLTGTGIGSPGAVKIKPSGVMTAFSPGTNNAQVLTSLVAVSFPAAGAHWTNMALVDGWQSGGTKFGTGNPAYTVRKGIVYLAGSTFTNSNPNVLMTTLPANARPQSALYIAVYVNGGMAGEIAIYPDGAIFAGGTTAALQTALDGVSFPTAAAALTWHKFTLATGWSSSQNTFGTGDPVYAVSGPIVYLAGSMHFDTNSGGDTTFAGIPTVIRTPHLIYQQVYTFGGSTGDLIMDQAVAVAGSNPATNAQQFTSLASVAYPRNS